MKKYLIIALSCMALPLIAVSCGNKAKKAAAEAAAKAQEDSIAAVKAKEDSIKMENKLAELPVEPVFDIITNMGTITVKLYSKTPKHRDNFAKLALSGYYNGILFHRVIDGFMIQAGDPLTKTDSLKAKWGTGGPDYTIPAEFVPEYKHKKGALAAARRGDAANPYKESSGSQFYLVQSPEACAQLDGEYTVYGETLTGLELIDKIAGVETDARACPLSPVKIITVKIHEEK
jgi:cyclophilin family peptidyl-prolyl cis-trans isomerase